MANSFDRLSTSLGDLPSDLDTFVPIAAKTELGYDFQIGKYPVTNAQFRRFFEAGGYAADRPWWTPEIVADIESWEYNKEWRNGPRLWDDDRFNHATQPVVGVSWYEAMAYCAWLTGELRAKGEIGENEEVRLPTQAEWMRAALPPSNSPRNGGVLSLSKEGRADFSSGKSSSSADSSRRAGGRADGAAVDDWYPWGSADFDPARANTEESGLGQTTPVQMYPEGASAEGVWDLAGNVWEWSADWNENKYPWLKGGSYYQNADGVRTSSRDWNDPWSGVDIGLRCVVIPGSR